MESPPADVVISVFLHLLQRPDTHPLCGAPLLFCGDLHRFGGGSGQVVEKAQTSEVVTPKSFPPWLDLARRQVSGEADEA
uniref:Uncharacterized protein n=1 Tax=Leersia perrieri TaxID=77586 RepID=A0A0D9XAE0_9ORYZ